MSTPPTTDPAGSLAVVPVPPDVPALAGVAQGDPDAIDRLWALYASRMSPSGSTCRARLHLCRRPGAGDLRPPVALRRPLRPPAGQRADLRVHRRPPGGRGSVAAGPPGRVRRVTRPDRGPEPGRARPGGVARTRRRTRRRAHRLGGDRGARQPHPHPTPGHRPGLLRPAQPVRDRRTTRHPARYRQDPHVRRSRSSGPRWPSEESCRDRRTHRVRRRPRALRGRRRRLRAGRADRDRVAGVRGSSGHLRGVPPRAGGSSIPSRSCSTCRSRRRRPPTRSRPPPSPATWTSTRQPRRRSPPSRRGGGAVGAPRWGRPWRYWSRPPS